MKNIFNFTNTGKNTRNAVLHLITIFILGSCQQEIDWKVKESQKRLVIESTITDELKYQQVTLSITGPYFDAAPPQGAKGAIVYISDGINKFEFQELPGNSGIYESKEKFKVEAGKTYTLDVKLNNEINNNDHFTASSTVQRSFPTESVVTYYKESESKIDKNKKEYYILVFIFGKEAKTKGDYYMIKLFDDKKAIADTVTKNIFINDDTWEINGLSGIITWSKFDNDPQLLRKKFSVEVYSIDKQYENYVRDLEEATLQPDPFGMTGPPANIKGNLSGGALGYFLAAPVTRDTCTVKEYDSEEAEFLKSEIEKPW